jgi:hypothetical protein
VEVSSVSHDDVLFGFRLRLFSLVASVVCAGLVWLGFAVGRLTRRGARAA